MANDLDNIRPLPPEQRAVADRIRSTDERNRRIYSNEPGHADSKLLGSPEPRTTTQT